MTTKIHLIYLLLLSNNIQQPRIVICQVVQECGWNVDSKNATERNNIFGYKSNANFESLEECVKTYKKWQQKYYKGGDYYDFLNCVYVGSKGDCKRYAGDTKYTDKLKMINKILWKIST